MVNDPETRLVERDIEILREHFGRFRISTNEALHRLYWEGRTADAAKKWIQRMRRGHYVLSGSLARGRQFLFPTYQTTIIANISRRCSRPPKGYDLARLYGVLSFCCLGPTKFAKLSSNEFQQEFELLCKRNLDQSLYYTDTSFEDGQHPQRNRLGYILVDAGGRVRQIVSRFQRVVSCRLQVPVWHQWIERDRFLITVVTADPGKARRFRSALNAIRQPVAFRIEVREDLLSVIPTESQNETERKNIQ